MQSSVNEIKEVSEKEENHNSSALEGPSIRNSVLSMAIDQIRDKSVLSQQQRTSPISQNID